MIFKTVSLVSLACGIMSLVTACGGGDSGSSGSVEEGITVTFTTSHHPSPMATGEIPKLPAGEKTFLNSEGVKITLKQAYLVIWSVKLETDCNTSLFAQWSPSWLDVFLPPLHAHTVTTPTQLGIPNVIDLLAGDTDSLTLGNIYPAPTSYCGMTVELLKADEDTQYLPKEIDLVNRVLYLSGEYTLPGTITPVAFLIDLAKTPRPRYLLFPQPLVLSSNHRTATVGMNIYYDRWFNAVNFAQLNEESQLDWLLNQVTGSIQFQ